MSVTTPADPVRRRRGVLGFAALATLAASVWALGDDAPEPARARAAPVAQQKPRMDAPSPEPLALLSLPTRGAPSLVRRNLFEAAQDGTPVATQQAAVAAPPPPPVITLPFSFGGRLVTDAGASVLLNDGPMTYVLAPGASQGDFRFERDAGGQLEFVHVPSGQLLTLPLQP